MKPVYLAAFAVVAALALSGCIMPETGPSGPVACTMEAKLCPDGGAVGRNGSNNCEFDQCQETTSTLRRPIGGDTDPHGCLLSGGYSWCEAKQKCLRVWEENCTLENDSDVCHKPTILCADNKTLSKPDPAKNCEYNPCPIPHILGKKDTNLGRFYINQSVIFNDTEGVKTATGVIHQLVPIQEEDIPKYPNEPVYLQYWNGTWTRYK